MHLKGMRLKALTRRFNMNGLLIGLLLFGIAVIALSTCSNADAHEPEDTLDMYLLANPTPPHHMAGMWFFDLRDCRAYLQRVIMHHPAAVCLHIQIPTVRKMDETEEVG